MGVVVQGGKHRNSMGSTEFLTFSKKWTRGSCESRKEAGGSLFAFVGGSPELYNLDATTAKSFHRRSDAKRDETRLQAHHRENYANNRKFSEKKKPKKNKSRSLSQIPLPQFLFFPH